jgi:hypothetical protein
MAEQIKFRLTKARAGLTLAILALVAGVTDRANSNTHAELSADQVTASPAAFDAFLKLDGITGATRTAFQKIESTFSKFDAKFDTAVAKIDQKFGKYDTAQKLDKTFLTSAAAGAEFLTPAAADGTFLTKDATATNSGELGGKTADAFVQGTGEVATGALTLGGAGGLSGDQTLVQSPGTPAGEQAAIIVVCTPSASNGTTVNIQNTTGSTIPAVMDQGVAPGVGSPSAASTNQMDLAPSPASNTFTITPGEIGQFHLQTFPTSSFNHVVTLIMSTEPAAGGTSIVAQMINGDG